MWQHVPEDLASDEHITASASLHYFLTSRGLTIEDLRVHPVVLAAFQPALHRQLIRLTGSTPATHWIDPARVPLAHGEAEGRPVSVVLLPIGAPWTVAVCEQLIAGGANTIIATGAAGSLTDTAPIGAFVVPEHAIREEGTSYHYAAPEIAARPDAALADALAEAVAARGAPALRGSNWTTDAPFREVQSKVRRYAEQGVVSVDMEASAMFILGQRRQVAVASLLIVSDELFHPWKPAFYDREYLRRTGIAAQAVVEVAGRWAHARQPRPH